MAGYDRIPGVDSSGEFPPEVKKNVVWRKGLTDFDTTRSMSDYFRQGDNGLWRLPPSYTMDMPSGLSSYLLSVEKSLEVKAFGAAGEQTLRFYGTNIYYRRSIKNYTTTPPTWTTWVRSDVSATDFEALNSRVGVYYKQPTLAAGTDLNEMGKLDSTGTHVLLYNSEYVNLPPNRPSNTHGALFVHVSGAGDGYQIVSWRFGGGSYQRFQTNTNTWTDWVKIDTSGSSSGTESDKFLDSRLSALEYSLNLLTPFEGSGKISTLLEGQAFERRLANNKKFNNITLEKLGETSAGNSINGLILGDATKPALCIMCAQHGDEIAGREAVLPWLRELATSKPAVLNDVCVAVIPAMNVDNLAGLRLTANQSDMNRNWVNRTITAVQVALAFFAKLNPIAVIDAHEGGNWTDAQLASPSYSGVPSDVQAKADSLLSVVQAKLTAQNIPNSLYPPSGILETAVNSLAFTEGYPTMLVETPSQLGGTTWEGPEPNPRLYAPPLDTRVEMYTVILDAALEWAGNQV